MNLARRCEQLSAPVRRLLALIVMPCGVLLILSLLYAPAAFLRSAQADWRDEAQMLLAQAKNAPAVKATLNEQLAQLQSSASWSKFYAAEPTGAAATMLQADVTGLLGSVQASAQSWSPIPSQPLPQFTRIGARLTASMRIDQLRGFLAAVAAHSRHLKVEQATIVAPQSQGAQENAPLAVTLEIHGYELRGDAQAQVKALQQLAPERAT